MAIKLHAHRKRVLMAKAKQYDRACEIMRRYSVPHKNAATHLRGMHESLGDTQRRLDAANNSLNWIDQLRQDEGYHDTHTLDEFITTLFCKVKSIDAVVSEARAAQDELVRLKQADGVPAKFEVVYDSLNKRYDIAIPLPSGRQVRKPILNGCIEVRQQQTVLDVKRRDAAISQLKDLIAYYQGLLAYVESKPSSA